MTAEKNRTVQFPAFATLVKSRLAAKKISLRELCRRAGMDASLLSKVLSGKRNPPWENYVLDRLAVAMEVSPAEVFVCAGRIPVEWSRLQEDRLLFNSVNLLVRNPGRHPALPDTVKSPAPPAEGTGYADRHSQLAEELL
ncbi:MAG: helix-turn-helix transcriptional regulator [bacterium]